MGMVCVCLSLFVLIGNIMNTHDCRKRTSRSRKAEKQKSSEAGKTQNKKAGKQKREQEKNRSRKAKEQTSRKAEKQKSREHRLHIAQHGLRMAQHDPNIAQTGYSFLPSLRKYHLICYYSDSARIGELVWQWFDRAATIATEQIYD